MPLGESSPQNQRSVLASWTAEIQASSSLILDEFNSFGKISLYLQMWHLVVGNHRQQVVDKWRWWWWWWHGLAELSKWVSEWVSEWYRSRDGYAIRAGRIIENENESENFGGLKNDLYYQRLFKKLKLSEKSTKKWAVCMRNSETELAAWERACHRFGRLRHYPLSPKWISQQYSWWEWGGQEKQTPLLMVMMTEYETLRE